VGAFTELPGPSFLIDSPPHTADSAMAIGFSVPPNGGDVEFVFMGTGTSSSLPNIECVTASFQARKCKTCLSTLTPEGKKNIRRNTSGVIRMPSRKDPDRQVYVCLTCF
jgi:hypothetical protein